MKIAAVSSYFNPVDYAARKEVTLEFLKDFQRHDIPLYLVEVSSGKHKPLPLLSRDAVKYRKLLKSDDVLWFKECAMNVAAEAALNDGADAVMFVDADIKFRTGELKALLEKKLLTHNAVHCYQFLHTIKSNFMPIRRKSCTVVFQVQQGIYKNCGTTGKAWAFTKQLLEHLGGMFDMMPVSFGDRLIPFGLFCDTSSGSDDATNILLDLFMLNEKSLHSSMSWCRRLGSMTGFDITDPPRIDIDIEDIFRPGQAPYKQYNSDVSRLRDFDFDPERDLERDENGLIRWSDDTENRLRGFIYSCFARRREDG